MKLGMIVMAGLLASGCTSRMYVGRTEFKDEAGKTCEAQAYWYTTSHLFGKKADRFTTVNSGGGRAGVVYKERGDSVTHLGEAEVDAFAQGETPEEGRFTCGRMIGVRRLIDFTGKSFALTQHCEAVRDEFTISQGYLPARETPYTFTVTEERLFSFAGKLPAAPRPPGCSERADAPTPRLRLRERAR